MALVYGAMLAAAVGAFLLLRAYGEGRHPYRPAAAALGAGSPRADQLPHVLGALVAVILLGLVLGKLFARVGQPPVIGEVVAGILLGPSLLGHALSSAILPAAAAPGLGILAQLGVILYMFLVGLDLNAELVASRVHVAIAASHASIVVPFLLGSCLALGLYPRLAGEGVPFTSFALFMGLAMSITAFPVLARILSDVQLAGTRLGAIALSCAATDDVTAWCLLALVVSVAKSQGTAGLVVAVLALAYLALVVFAVRPLARRLSARWPASEPPRGAVALVYLALLTSALITESIGIHAIFGAFLLGAVIPHDSRLSREFKQQLEPLVTIVLLPAFFALTGMRTEIALVRGREWLITGVLVLVATVGKFGGTFAAARLTGLGGREAAALGILMNTRGLMELVVLNIGLDLGVLSPALFAMMVVMALVTTLATAPILKGILRGLPVVP